MRIFISKGAHWRWPVNMTGLFKFSIRSPISPIRGFSIILAMRTARLE